MKVFLVTLCALPLFGCATQRNVAYQNANIDSQLNQTAASIDESLRTLAATQEAYVSTAINTDPLVSLEGGMGGRATIDWSGPIEPLLEKICGLTHYKLKVLGPQPAVPVIVSITAQDRLIADIVKDAGLQAQKKANIVVYPKMRIIELRYVTA